MRFVLTPMGRPLFLSARRCTRTLRGIGMISTILYIFVCRVVCASDSGHAWESLSSFSASMVLTLA